jgi:hypothetical protein
VPCRSEAELIALAAALLPETVGGCSPAEIAILAGTTRACPAAAEVARSLIRAGADPLGDAFAHLRSAAQRRPLGATYTPHAVVRLMLDWAESQEPPARVVDPGVGSARFLVEAGRRFPAARLIGVEIDPVAALIARANLAAAGLAARADVILRDYRSLTLPVIEGRTLFIGNPPYIRHHLIPSVWKRWLTENAAKLEVNASQLAGLHAYFYVATALLARPGDAGAFITAAEWLDVNYGRLVRELFIENLGGRDLLVLEPTARTFADAMTTAAVTTFVVGSASPTVRVSRADGVEGAGALGTGHPIHRERFAQADRWSHLTRAARQVPGDFVELGELCRVHRGAVTGANKVWIAGDHSYELPGSVLFPSVTRARELFAAGFELENSDRLRRVIDLPEDLDVFEGIERRAVEGFLKRARASGAHLGYVATHRRAWWSVGLRQPPPIMATYMARRPPAFVRNRAGARYINIAHGLYPREPLNENVLNNLTTYLSRATSVTDGRTYAGGLTKFEPREMERLLVPTPAALSAETF